MTHSHMAHIWTHAHILGTQSFTQPQLSLITAADWAVKGKRTWVGAAGDTSTTTTAVIRPAAAA